MSVRIHVELGDKCKSAHSTSEQEIITMMVMSHVHLLLKLAANHVGRILTLDEHQTVGREAEAMFARLWTGLEITISETIEA